VLLTPAHHALAEPSRWLLRWVHLIRPGGHVLDLACGRGRHVHWLRARGFTVTAVDRDADALSAVVAQGSDGIEVICADLESEPWPLPGRRFDAVLVTNYLWRPLFADLRRSLADGGVWLHETFAAGNETVGRPARPAFLLEHGELLCAAEGLRVVAYEDGFLDPPPRFVQRIAAVAPFAVGPSEPVRHPLAGPDESRPGG
jgi:SAM-dependent methyltransferase